MVFECMRDSSRVLLFRHFELKSLGKVLWRFLKTSKAKIPCISSPHASFALLCVRFLCYHFKVWPCLLWLAERHSGIGQ